MCNDFGNHIPYSDYLAAFSHTRIPLRWPASAPNLEPRDDIWPTDKAPVIRRLEDGTNEFTELRWGFPPGRPEGAPVINVRSEGRRFPVGRCLIPASHFFEFTGTKSPKTKWKFIKVREDWFCFAGLWRPMSDGCAAFTLLTTEPGPDVVPIHDRQMVVLNRSEWSAWLEQTGNALTAASFDNPDFVDVVIQSYRHRYGNAPGDPAYEASEQKLAAQPAISVPTIVLHGDADGVGPPSGSEAAARHFTGSYSRRAIPVAGHFLPRETPEAVVAAIKELGGK